MCAQTRETTKIVVDSEGNEEVTVTRSQDHKRSHDYGGKQKHWPKDISDIFMLQAMNYTHLTQYLDHLGNCLTGFLLKINDHRVQ